MLCKRYFVFLSKCVPNNIRNASNTQKTSGETDANADTKKQAKRAQIRRFKEDKLLYGDLLETKGEKRERLKRGKPLPVLESSVDSEAAWATAHTTKEMEDEINMQLNSLKNESALKDPSAKSKSISNPNAEQKIPFVMPNNIDIYTPRSTKRVWARITSQYNKIVSNNKKLSQTKQNKDNENIDACTIPTTTTVNSTPAHSDKLSDIIIKNMPSFSIFDTTSRAKDYIPRIDDPIISMLAQQDSKWLHFPSVTTILRATMSEESKQILEQWKAKMISTLGIEGFEKYSKELLMHGAILHSSIRNNLKGIEEDVPASISPAFNSVAHILKDLQCVKALESHVVHPKLHYRGIVDCVALYRNKLTVIDWKKSDKPKKSLAAVYDAPVQIASYIGAVNASPNYEFLVEAGLVVVAYTSGEIADVHELSGDVLQHYWKLWLTRLQQYHSTM